MGVYIKGMKMPETCGKCKLNFLTDDYVCCSITDRIPKIVGKYANSKTDLDYRLKSIESVKRPEWCPLVEVKEPHGRLGDLDYLYDVFQANGCTDSLVYMLIKAEPTVIEGSE